MLELLWPAATSAQEADLLLGTVTHGFRPWAGLGGATEASLAGTSDCNIDVNCSPEGDAWQDEKRGVVQLLIANTGAPPFQIYVLPQKLEKETFVGTFSLFIAFGNALKVLPYFMLGQLNPTNLGTSAVLLPLAIATNMAGVWLVRRTPAAFFYKVVYLLIFLIGIELIYTGASKVLGG